MDNVFKFDSIHSFSVKVSYISLMGSELKEIHYISAKSKVDAMAEISKRLFRFSSSVIHIIDVKQLIGLSINELNYM